ncbi:hypothetical protein BpHYR1_014627 [Brachionus plicatilis]|uniref:Ubiquitin carboxyl-terminal hydrolase 7 n=1 Tax=Brachionus plicatilis TaxID=10195 RepID=A0A3M7T7U6_BRAPC|nr:hypothetical protein BpHYR1_014627 [Brachionus plicatilis]
MNDLSIVLPCGFSVKFNDIIYKSGIFQCPACKKHDITRQECLNMTKNKMLINEINLNLKWKKYEELMKELEKFKDDPKYYIDESFDSLKREVDLRREEVKDMINKKIDDYYDGLLEKIDIERNLKFKDLEERILQTETLSFFKSDADKNLEICSKLDFFEKNIIKIDNEIDDDSRTKATIQFTINNFSLLKDRKNFRICSKKCFLRNFEWFFDIELNEENGWMEFYLYCNSKAESNKFPKVADIINL